MALDQNSLSLLHLPSAGQWLEKLSFLSQCHRKYSLENNQFVCCLQRKEIFTNQVAILGEKRLVDRKINPTPDGIARLRPSHYDEYILMGVDILVNRGPNAVPSLSEAKEFPSSP